MIIRGLDKDGDWVFGIGGNAYKSTQEAIMQNIATKIREWVGDCFFNNNAGIDWLNRLSFGQKNRLTADLTSLILKCYGVVGLTQLSVSLNANRNYSVTFTVSTFYSQSAQSTISNPS